MISKKIYYCENIGLMGHLASLMVDTVKHLPAMQMTRLQSMGGEDPLEKEMANPLQYSCLKNFMDRNWVGYSPRSLQEPNRTMQTDTHLILSLSLSSYEALGKLSVS